jgi:hypothetical protein
MCLYVMFVSCIIGRSRNNLLLDVVEITNAVDKFAPLLFFYMLTEPRHSDTQATLYDKPPYRYVFSRNSDGSRSSLKMADYCRNM